jgi:7-cyano-7-deazaguanine synthase
MSNKKQNVVLSLSGGMDSSTLLLRCLEEYENVVGISFDYGQKHRVELERAQDLVNYLNQNGKNITYQVIKLDGLSQLLNSSLVEGGSEVPEGHYAEENQKQTVVPNRNKIFASIVQAIALSVVGKKNEKCDIALGIHAGDFGVYPDCRQEFRDADDVAFRLGNWDAENVSYFTPYLHGMKFDILKDGERLCNQLRLDFNEVYKRTNTSYKPIKHIIYYDNEDESTGEIVENQLSYEEWFSDYKSASSVERVEAFIKLGRKDPVLYADEHGPVEWDYVVSYVSEILKEHAEAQLQSI